MKIRICGILRSTVSASDLLPDLSAHNDFSEDRIQTIGSIGKVIFVVYTERNNRCRIISARKANAKERELYYGYSDIQTEGWGRAVN